MGYKNRTNNVGYLTAKIHDADLVQKVNDHCKRMNIGTSDFVEECVRKYIEDAYHVYLQTLSKEDLIELIMSKQKDDETC